MVSYSLLVALCGLALCAAQSGGGQQQPECSSEFRDFGECMKSNAGEPPKPDFDTIKKEMDGCFESSGCTPPNKEQRFQGQNGPGGRAGPPPNSTLPPEFQCFSAVHKKLFEQMSDCLKEKDPDFAKNGFPPFPGHGPGGPGGFGPPPGGPPPGFGPPPGGPPPGFGPPPGGPPPGFGPPPGGPPPGFGPPPFGPGGHHGGPPPVELLTKSCGDDPEKTAKLLTCIQGVQEKHKPSKEEVKPHYDAMCKAVDTCKPKLGKCEDIMKKKGQAMCECHAKGPNPDEVFSKEPSCANVKKPPFPGPPEGEKPDCSKPPPNPCEEGFDKFYERISKFPPPPPPPQP